MFVLDLVGAFLTLITLAFLALAGLLIARRLLGTRALADPLAFAIAALVATTTLATLIGVALGAVGQLRIELALLVLALAVVVLLRLERAAGDPWAPARLAGRRAWSRLREHPALALIAAHAVATEGLRGLLRPPLSWDSLMYHLLLTATWLQQHTLAPVFGMKPTNFYGYMPGGGSVWTWWWMSPSHSELYVNLAFFPQAALLALAVGGVARELGARRSWPGAAFLALLTPTVIRFAATQYVDILVGAGIAAATFFALRWWREEAGWGDALLAGAGLGLAAGAKVLGLAYALGLAAAAVALAGGGWRRRLPQIGAALLLCAAVGAFWYGRNFAAGAGPLGAGCDSNDVGVKIAPAIPRINTVAYLWRSMLGEGDLLDAFLGVTQPFSLELGVGPQTFLLLPALLLPLGFAGSRRPAFLVWSQIALQLAIWVTVPYASDHVVFANVRYLVGALGLAFAGIVAWGERRGLSQGWMTGIVAALAVQDLLMFHAVMPHGVRLALAVADVAAVWLALSSWLRGFVRGRWRELAVAAALAALVASPFLARFRVRDRERALAQEFTAHYIPTALYAGAWYWLDNFGGDGTVAAAGAPLDAFSYPAMGPHLERRVIYANVNRRGSRNAADYPRCDPSGDGDAGAWIESLQRQDVRWIWLYHMIQAAPGAMPVENDWAQARPDLFRPRFRDANNAIYELLSWQQRHVADGAAPP